MKVHLYKNLIGTWKLSVLTAMSFLVVIPCLIGGILCGWDAYATVVGDLPVDKTSMADWGRLGLLLLFVLTPALFGAYLSTFLTMYFAKHALKLPRASFASWLDATNGQLHAVRKHNEWWLNKLYKEKDV